ncbi:hypothetical protein BDF14DRAFT_1886464 [Spinellus fusiger]|nr:hypothetical protein BDF14DRAFT_1886464 [Spinellus fusiger]
MATSHPGVSEASSAQIDEPVYPPPPPPPPPPPSTEPLLSLPSELKQDPLPQEYSHYGPQPTTETSVSVGTPSGETATPMGSPVAAKRHSMEGLETRAYLDTTVVPTLLQGMKLLSTERPNDPLSFLGHFLLARAHEKALETPHDP